MAESNPCTDKDYSKFDQMDTAELEEILRMDFQLSEAAKLETDEILYITEVIARREKENPTRPPIDLDKAWESFNQNYRPYANDEGSLYDFEGSEPCDKSETADEPSVSAQKKGFLSWIAGIAAALVLIVCAFPLSVGATGYNLFELLGQWTSEIFSFGDASSGLSDEKEYATLQEALDDYGITEQVAPSWIPKWYLLSSLVINDDDPKNISFCALYQHGEDEIAITIEHNMDSSMYEKDDSSVAIYEKNGIKHYIMFNADYNYSVVVWSNNGIECWLNYTDLSQEELEKMIDSIYERSDGE